MIPQLHLEPIISNQRNERGRFIKGMTPWNKGKKHPVTKNRHTFSKGNIPPNSKEQGYEAIRKKRGEKYIMVKVGRRMIRKNRWLWEQHNGKIPQKHIIGYKDGNSLNCVIDNLYIISMSENIKRNHNRKKAALTLKGIWDKERLRIEYGLPQKTKFKPNMTRL